ncbi:MAG: C1 family peptidase [Promethearchaeota archaeon]
MANRYAYRCFWVIFLASFMVSGLSIFSSETLGIVGIIEADDNIPQKNENLSPETIFESRIITNDDIMAMKNNYTEWETIENHNIIIQGHGTGLSPPTDASLSSLIGNTLITGLSSSALLRSPFLTASYDLSADPAFPATGNQGNQGSCAAWAVGYYAYGYMEAKDNLWPASEGDPAHLMSPAWIYNKINMGEDAGSYLHEAGMILEDYGGATLASMPYDPSDYTDWGNETAWREAPLHRSAELSYVDSTNINETIEIIKVLISEGTPIVFGIDAYQYPDGEDMNVDFILSSVDYNSDILNHANTIVGFNDSITKDGDIGAFRVVNSWGVTFGEGGYYWITYEAFKELFGISGYGQSPIYISDIPDYTPTLIATWNFSKNTRRTVEINVSLGDYPTGIFEKDLYFNGGTSAYYPSFMAVDISEMFPDYSTQSHYFFLEMFGNSNGVVESFHIEAYYDSYALSIPTRISEPTSPNSFDIPGYATVILDGVPTIPINIQAGGLNQSIQLSWDVPNDNGGFQIGAYTVYRFNDPQWETIAILGNQTTQYLDSYLPNGETQIYVITANNSLGESPYSQTASTFPHTFSSPPLNFSGVIEGNTTVITWIPPIDTGGTDIEGYQIYRANSTQNLTLYVENFDALQFMENLTTWGNYTYAISVLNLAGESILSENVTLEYADDSEDDSDDDSNGNSTNIPWSVLIPVTIGIGTIGVVGLVGYAAMKSRR